MNMLEKFVRNREQCTPDEVEKVIRKLSSGHLTPEEMKWMSCQWHHLKDQVVPHQDEIDFDAVLHKIHHDINIIESKQEKSRFVKIRKLQFYTQAVAAVLFVALSVIGIWYAGKTGIFQNAGEIEFASVRGQSLMATLPDGSQVWLNGQSAITFHSSYGVKNRELTLKGEGFFEVASGHSRPFVVHVCDVTVTAVGTGFNIDASGGPESVIVTLESGEIYIDRGTQRRYMNEGQQAVIHEKFLTVSEVDTELFTSWRTGRVAFKNETLRNITLQLEKLYDVEFVFESEQLRDYRYRGTLYLDHTVLKALEMLEISTGVQYEIRGSRIYLRMD
jgi:transmembrane sensor